MVSYELSLNCFLRTTGGSNLDFSQAGVFFFNESMIFPAGSLNYLFGKNQTIQMYTKLYKCMVTRDLPQKSCII